MTKTDLWDRLGRTDPAHTKPFQRAGGFRGTAIKPIYSYRRMTEEFGPCGTGWGINKPSFQVVTGSEGEVLVYCTVSIWYGQRDQVAYGVGGDKVVVKQSSGLRGDDEAFKKAFTDGITNALKVIGVGADVHMGLFDDSKYVNSLKEEFAEPRQNPHVTRPEDIAPKIERTSSGQPVDNIPAVADAKPKSKAKAREDYATIQNEIWATINPKDLETWGKTNAARVGDQPADWQEIIRGTYREHMDALRAQDNADNMRMAG